MDTQIWKSSSTDLSASFVDQKYDEIQTYADDNIRNLLNKWLHMQHEDLRLSLTYGRSVIGYFIASLGKNDRDLSLVKAGALLGTIESLEKLLNDFRENERLENDDRFRIKHLKEVISALETHGSMTHTELCDSLNIKASTLSEAMRKILSTGLINVSYYGKYKCYSLSDSGIRYGRLIRRKQAALQDSSIVKNVEMMLSASVSQSAADELKEIVSKWLIEKGSLTLSQNDIFNYYDSYDQSNKIARIKISDLSESSGSDGRTEKNIIGTNSMITERSFLPIKKHLESLPLESNYSYV